MFFYASKLFWFLVAPGNLLLLLLLTGVLLLWSGRRRWGNAAVSLAALLALVIAVAPAGSWMTVRLEDRFPVPDPMPARVDGVIVLGGAVDPVLSVARGQVSLTSAAERITEIPRLLERYPRARVVFAGGSGDPFEQRFKEADIVAPILLKMGIGSDRLILENRSRNTWESAVATRDLVAPRPDRVWLLVTSAFHMPRAMGCFRRAGWNVVAMPVDYAFRGPEDVTPGFSLTGGLSTLSRGLHEWIGLAVYYLAGRTDAVFPGPETNGLKGFGDDHGT